MVEMKSLFKIVKPLNIICLVAILISCEQVSLSNILCGNNIRYWEYEDDDYHKFPIYFLFDMNGRWYPLEQDEQGNVKKYNLSDCIRYNEKWSLQDDSILYLGWSNKGYIIQSYCDSLILLKQGDKLFKMRGVNAFQDAVQKNTKRYHEILDSIKNINYEIIVDSMIRRGNIFLVLGTTFYGEKTTLAFNKEDGRTLNLHKKDSLIKKRNWGLINKINGDSVSLYNYFISSRDCSLLKRACGLKKNFKSNIDGVFVE